MNVRPYALAFVVSAAILGSAGTAHAAPCDSAATNVEYALAVASGVPMPAMPVLQQDMCVDSCNNKCDYLGSGESWDSCYYPCIKGCLPPKDSGN